MEAAQKALSTLISGRRRSSGEHWEHAFGMMAAYLKVGARGIVARRAVVDGALAVAD